MDFRSRKASRRTDGFRRISWAYLVWTNKKAANTAKKNGAKKGGHAEMASEGKGMEIGITQRMLTGAIYTKLAVDS